MNYEMPLKQNGLEKYPYGCCDWDNVIYLCRKTQKLCVCLIKSSSRPHLVTWRSSHWKKTQSHQQNTASLVEMQLNKDMATRGIYYIPGWRANQSSFLLIVTLIVFKKLFISSKSLFWTVCPFLFILIKLFLKCLTLYILVSIPILFFSVQPRLMCTPSP